jgi:hypothetical protein
MIDYKTTADALNIFKNDDLVAKPGNIIYMHSFI